MTISRVWIELEKPTSLEHAKLQCELTNRMLKRLKCNMVFFVSYKKHSKLPIYNIELNDSGMYAECPDNGHWFNLDFLSVE